MSRDWRLGPSAGAAIAWLCLGGGIAYGSPIPCSTGDECYALGRLRDGWFHSGDLGYLDEDGWLYFVDRERDVIRRGGENVSSVLVEKVLRDHARVGEVAVIGVPDPVLGQEIKAYVSGRLLNAAAVRFTRQGDPASARPPAADAAPALRVPATGRGLPRGVAEPLTPHHVARPLLERLIATA